MSVTIVSGCPGCGKTSVSRLLAAAEPRGVHLASDCFFDFLTHPIDPSLPASKMQNETVVRAYAQAAATYSAGGYSVILDGVIGPWLFPLILPIVPRFGYVLLHASLPTAVKRVRNRDGDSAEPAVVERMHGQFSDIIGEYQRHLISTENTTVEDILVTCQQRAERLIIESR